MPVSKLESATRASQLESLPSVFQVWKNQPAQPPNAPICPAV